MVERGYMHPNSQLFLYKVIPYDPIADRRSRASPCIPYTCMHAMHLVSTLFAQCMGHPYNFHFILCVAYRLSM